MSPQAVNPQVMSRAAASMADQLWNLLPAIHRERDAEANPPGALRALIEILAEQAAVVSGDLAQLYENLFIETCQPWVVPYVGDLVAAPALHDIGHHSASPRAWVANTVSYRSRKGTVAALEAVVRDVTGWPARLVEGISVVAVTQHLAHVRPGKGATVDVRDATALERLGGAFETAARRGDVRTPPAGSAAAADVTLHIWRLPTFTVRRSEPRPVAQPPDGRYTFDPTGIDVPLFNPPLPVQGMDSAVVERNMPGPLRPRALQAALDAETANPASDPGGYFGINPVVSVRTAAEDGVWSSPRQLVITGLRGEDWPRPSGEAVAVDPLSGRLALPEGDVPAFVEVTYTHAGSAIGAGPYDRSSASVSDLLSRATFVRVVVPGPAASADLVAAMAEWGQQPPGTVGVVAVIDSRTYRFRELDIRVPPGSELLVAATDWPGIRAAEAQKSAGYPALDGTRPAFIGSIVVTGIPRDPADPDPPAPGRLVLDGFVLEGRLNVAPGDLGSLELRHVTAVPGRTDIHIAGRTPRGRSPVNSDLTVTLDTSITGQVAVDGEGPGLEVSGSIVDGVRHAGNAIHAPAAPVALNRTTALGDVVCRSLEASDALVDGSVTAQRRQEGFVRYSAISGEALTPRRYRCAYDMELRRPPGLMPQFGSERYGDPGYAVLADRCPERLLVGSSLASDIGAHAALLRPQRMANLHTVLREHLRAGLQAGVVPQT